jgi:multidrug transporter EmrE-like cation transporter
VGSLFVSVALEIVGDLLLKWWTETNRWCSYGLRFLGYVIAMEIFGLMLRRGELAIIFSLWAGRATIGVTLAGWWWFNEVLILRQLAGMALIFIGVIILGGK